MRYAHTHKHGLPVVEGETTNVELLEDDSDIPVRDLGRAAG